jgi:hypothetical protein
MSFDKKAFIKFLHNRWFYGEDRAEDTYPFLLESIQNGTNTQKEAAFFKEEGDKEACIEFVKDAIEKGKRLAALLKEINDKVVQCIEIADDVGLPCDCIEWFMY